MWSDLLELLMIFKVVLFFVTFYYLLFNHSISCLGFNFIVIKQDLKVCFYINFVRFDKEKFRISLTFELPINVGKQKVEAKVRLH